MGAGGRWEWESVWSGDRVSQVGKVKSSGDGRRVVTIVLQCECP